MANAAQHPPMVEMLGGGTGSWAAAKAGHGLLMVGYNKAWNASALPFHFLLLIFIEALVHMGWCDYNTALGFKIPESHTGELSPHCRV